MKSAMRTALKECLGDKKRSFAGKRASAYGGRETAAEEEAEHEMDKGSGSAADRAGSGSKGPRGTQGGEKALRSKVAEAEGAAHEEMQESGNWQEEDVKQFMRKRATPKVKRSGSFAAVVAAGKKGKGEKKG